MQRPVFQMLVIEMSWTFSLAWKVLQLTVRRGCILQGRELTNIYTSVATKVREAQDNYRLPYAYGRHQ